MYHDLHDLALRVPHICDGVSVMVKNYNISSAGRSYVSCSIRVCKTL